MFILRGCTIHLMLNSCGCQKIAFCFIYNINDDTDVFVLFLQLFCHLKLSLRVIMKGTSGEHVQVDIGTRAKRHNSIIPNLIAAHALTEYDTMARLNGKGKSVCY